MNGDQHTENAWRQQHKVPVSCGWVNQISAVKDISNRPIVGQN